MFKYELSFFTNYSYFAIFIVTFHSLCDTIGRYLGGIEKLANMIPKKWFMLACMGRVVFVVLYLFTFTGVEKQIFSSDWFIIANLGLFSISCGFLSTIGMKYGSDESCYNQALAGSLMGFHMVFGICLGSAIALIFLK